MCEQVGTRREEEAGEGITQPPGGLWAGAGGRGKLAESGIYWASFPRRVVPVGGRAYDLLPMHWRRGIWKCDRVEEGPKKGLRKPP